MVQYKATIKTKDGGNLIFIGTKRIIVPKIESYINEQYSLGLILNKSKFAFLVNDPTHVSKYIKSKLTIERIF